MLKWLRKLFPPAHKWSYHNPYDRTCKICGRREVSVCWTLETWRQSWWETYIEGNGKDCSLLERKS